MEETRKEAVVALGMFDGMHLGHQSLLRRTRSLAAEWGCVPAAFTFTNHPLEILGGRPKLLSSAGERAEIMRACGIEDICMVPFTRELAGCEPAAFIELLQSRWKLNGVVVGFNYTFGRYGAGTPKTLHSLGKRMGFHVHVIQPVLYGGTPVSSTRIRQCVEDGDLLSANSMLLRPYPLQGTVVSNLHNGVRLGFPTANIEADPLRVIPKRGVYAVNAILGPESYRAVTNIGVNPTLGGERETIETHIPRFSRDLYGQQLGLHFLFRIRGEIAFDSEEALKTQIQKDILRAKKGL